MENVKIIISLIAIKIVNQYVMLITVVNVVNQIYVQMMDVIQTISLIMVSVIYLVMLKIVINVTKLIFALNVLVDSKLLPGKEMKANVNQHVM